METASENHFSGMRIHRIQRMHFLFRRPKRKKRVTVIIHKKQAKKNKEPKRLPYFFHTIIRPYLSAADLETLLHHVFGRRRQAAGKADFQHSCHLPPILMESHDPAYSLP